jgi:hypothetical protein
MATDRLSPHCVPPDSALAISRGCANETPSCWQARLKEQVRCFVAVLFLLFGEHCEYSVGSPIHSWPVLPARLNATQIYNWDFSVFRLAEECRGKPLQAVTITLLDSQGLLVRDWPPLRMPSCRKNDS